MNAPDRVLLRTGLTSVGGGGKGTRVDISTKNRLQDLPKDFNRAGSRLSEF